MIPVEPIAQLAELFDRYNNALDPLSADCLRAKRQFDDLVNGFHATHGPEMNFLDFRYELIRRCRDYLRQNRP